MAITINGTANTVAGLAAGGLPDNTVDGGNLAMGSDAAGDVLYYNGTDYIRLAKGTDGQVLTLASGVPTWATATSNDNTPAFSAWLNTNTNIAHDSNVIVVFDSEQYDTDNAYNTSTGVFTVPSGKGGKYFISGQAWINDLDDNKRMELYLWIDGGLHSDFNTSPSAHSSGSGQHKASVYTNVVDLNAGQTVSIVCYHSETGTQVLVADRCWFTMFRLAGV